MTRGAHATDATIIDFCAHIHPDDPPETEFFNDFIYDDIGQPVYRDIDLFTEHYEQAGLDGAVLSQPLYMGHDDAERVAGTNDLLLEQLSGREHYYGLASIPTAAGGEEAAAEFERALDEGYNGGALETRSGGIELHHREAEPILEVADQTGAPVLVHPKLNNSLSEDALDDTWLLNAIFGREVAIAASMAKVIHTGVLDRYPDLNLVFHHTGGNAASMLGRTHNMLEMFRPEEWAERKGTSLDWQVKDFAAFERQMQERVYVDTAGHYGYHNVLRSALMQFPTSQMLFGTDFPFEIRDTEGFEDMITVIERELGTPDAGAVLGGNVLDLLVNTN
jgi:predicted TIM-barrel fold metal-dependent hydrolase